MDTQDEDEWMYCKRSNLLHASFTAGGKPPLSVKFLKKYLSMARRRGRCAPSLPGARRLDHM